ncbi:hypothetical protein DSM3645_02473 [Blastopirellula marina DSM 3645]|uniref:Uncharacterized protein n=1 Tax=Blastopirellula marina DSM 3645 TaxID=314230 RepID=A3ZVF8_9BACT|nr:hypothetical protein DSM3645_02473 [Blastopirellula marina DSM 3645]
MATIPTLLYCRIHQTAAVLTRLGSRRRSPQNRSETKCRPANA